MHTAANPYEAAGAGRRAPGHDLRAGGAAEAVARARSAATGRGDG